MSGKAKKLKISEKTKNYLFIIKKDFNVDRMKVIHEIPSEDEPLDITYIGNEVLAIVTRKDIALWNIATGELLRNIPGYVIDVLPENKFLVHNGVDTVDIYNLSDFSKFTLALDARGFTILSDNTVAASSGQTGSILYFSFDSMPPRLLHETENATTNFAHLSIKALPDVWLATMSYGVNSIKIWNGERQLVHALGETEAFRSIGYCSNVLVSISSCMRVWNYKTGECLKTIPIDTEESLIGIVPDRYIILDDDNTSNSKRSLNFYNMESSKPCTSISYKKLKIPSHQILLGFDIIDHQRFAYSFCDDSGRDKVRVLLFENSQTD